MKVTAEVQVIPLGAGVSVREPVQLAYTVLQEARLNAQLHANGTNLEGEISDVLAAVRHVHETLHAKGVQRLTTFIQLDTRTDKEPSLAAAIFET